MALTSYGFVPLLLQCRTPYAAVHTLVPIMMGMMVPETCWDNSLIINIRLVASCWFLSLHSNSSDAEDSNLLGCESVSSREYFQMFRRIIVEEFFLNCLTLKVKAL